jgi:P27 family predicted phage terminase small subunit
VALKPPAHLSRPSKAVWRRLVDDYSLDQEPAALLVLGHALSSHDRAEQARREVERDGLTVRTASGSIKAHPAVAVERDARLGCARMLRELSLDAEVLGGNGYEAARPPRVGGGTS